MPPSARVQKRLYYKIGEACKALDIQPYVLRYWETEFPALSPSKSRSGQRVYSEKELAIIRRIKELLYGEGYTIAGAKKRLETELESGALDEGGAAAAIESGEAEVSSAASEPELPLRPARRAAKAPAERAAKESAGSLEESAERLLEEPTELPTGRRIEPDLDLPLAIDDLELPAPSLDTRAMERIQTLRSGIRRALGEAREILALLERGAP